jgi:5-methylcytosine-specific restriction protein A
MVQSSTVISGRLLNELWGVGATHALYREDGKWYHQLEEFPGALFDANGYMVFQSKEEYLECPLLQIKQDLHISTGISSIPGYVRVTERNQIQVLSNQIKEVAQRRRNNKVSSKSRARVPRPIKTPEASDLSAPPETTRALSQTYRIIRDTEIARWVKYIHEYKCQICDAAISLSDGGLYAEAHHIKPLGGDHKGPDVVENIICVCPNHHAQLDYGAIQLDNAGLRSVSGHNINDEYIKYHNSVICHGAC